MPKTKKDLEKDITQLYNHAEIANREMGEVKTTMAIIKNDVAWLKKFFWVVASSAIGALGTGLLNLLK